MLLSMLITLIASVCITGLLGLGFLLIWSGICGETVDGHPLCGNCKFDLVGHKLTPHHCPECGAMIAREGGILMGHREQQMPRIVNGSILMVINLSIVGFCWWTAEHPANSIARAITQTVSIAPIPAVDSYANAAERFDNKETTEFPTNLSQDSIDVSAPRSLIILTDASAKTIAFQVDTRLSGNLIFPGNSASGANSDILNPILLFDRQSKLSLPAQPASGAIESHLRPVGIGKQFRSVNRRKNKSIADYYGLGNSAARKKSNSSSRVAKVNASKRMNTNKIRAQRAEQSVLGQYDSYRNKGNIHGTARKNLSHRGR